MTPTWLLFHDVSHQLDEIYVLKQNIVRVHCPADGGHCTITEQGGVETRVIEPAATVLTMVGITQ